MNITKNGTGVNPVELVLSKLPDAKPSGSGWSAPCPAHDDGSPSLSVCEGDDGRVLVYCHAGCSSEAIVEAMGLKMSDLMPDGGNGKPIAAPKAKKPAKVYGTANEAVEAEEQHLDKKSAMWTYYDANNEPVGYVIRWDLPNGKKTYRPISRNGQGQGWIVAAMPEPRRLYCQNELGTIRRVYICEGEKATDAARSLGLTAVTSSGGSKTAHKTDWSPLAGLECIFLSDNDNAGADYLNDVGTTLTNLDMPATVREVTLPDLPPGGDMADFVEANSDVEPETLRQRIEAMADAAPVWKPTAQPWPELTPFDVLDLPTFPTHVLPDVLRAWVEAESHATQTPADLAGLLALAVCSSTIARHVIVEPRPGWQEPVNLFVAVLLEPGNRKSAVFADAVAPLRELEAELIEDARPTVARAQSDRRQSEARLKKLEKIAAEKGDMEARKEAGDLAEELAEQPEPTLPRLIADDATSEKLGMMLHDQDGRIASLSPEGGVFDLMAGLYSKSGIPQFGVYLMGHSGDDLVTDRVGRKSVRVERPALTCGYAIQPAVVEGLAEQTAFRGRGLLARFLYSFPESWIGQRQVAPEPVSKSTREAYRQAMRALAESFQNIQSASESFQNIQSASESFQNIQSASEPFVLRLSSDAVEVFYRWETEIEQMLDDGGPLEVMRDWGAKLAGATLRLAAAIHCIQHNVEFPIDAATIAAAVELSQYLIPHAEAALELMREPDESSPDDAQYLLRWIERHNKRQFKKSEAQQHGKRRFPKADDIDPALAELTRRGYVRLVVIQLAKAGRPPSPTYEVNPVFFENQNTGKRSVYSKNSTDTPTFPPDRGNFQNIQSAFRESENQKRDPRNCPHNNVVESPPTFDGYVNRTCSDCGKLLGCQKQGQLTGKET
jgi:hypothetical protein